MICLNCGQENKDGTVYCSRCGADIIALDVRSARPGTAKWKKYVKLGYIDEAGVLDPLRFPEDEFPEAHFSIFLDPVQDQQITVSEDLWRTSGTEISLTRLRTNETFRIDQDQTVIGKVSQAMCRIDGNPAISRTHLNIFRQEGQVFVEDLNSSNHTYVDGRMIDAPVQVRDDSRIQMADEMFVLHIKEKKTPMPSSNGPGFCMNCGGKLSPGAKFCMNCGAKVR